MDGGCGDAGLQPVGPDAIPYNFAGSGTRGVRAFRSDWRLVGRSQGHSSFFMYTPDFAVLAFRGTEKDDWTDRRFSDVARRWRPFRAKVGDAQKTMFHLPGRQASSIVPYPPSIVAGSLNRHGRISTVSPTIARNLRTRSSSRVIVWARRSQLLRYRGSPVVHRSFGSPRVNQALWTAQVSQFRFVDLNDRHACRLLFSYAHGAWHTIQS